MFVCVCVSANIGDLQHTPPTIYSIETAPDPYAHRSTASVYKVNPRSNGVDGATGNYFHVNM